jgi:hypothetical protein
MNERNDITASIGVQELANKARELFDESVQALDGETASKLNRARHEALKQLQPKARQTPWLHWAPAAGVAAAAVIAVIVLDGRRPIDDLTSLPAASDFELLLNEDSFEMLEELEFYSWIDLEAELESNDNVG